MLFWFKKKKKKLQGKKKNVRHYKEEAQHVQMFIMQSYFVMCVCTVCMYICMYACMYVFLFI